MDDLRDFIGAFKYNLDALRSTLERSNITISDKQICAQLLDETSQVILNFFKNHIDRRKKDRQRDIWEDMQNYVKAASQEPIPEVVAIESKPSSDHQLEFCRYCASQNIVLRHNVVTDSTYFYCHDCGQEMWL